MFSSSSKLIFNLFLPENNVKKLATSQEGWQNVSFSFFPDQGRPTNLR